jgi:hypothetical protein
MLDRCFKPSCKEYRWYGAKGISCDPRWKDFQNFYDDMGDCPPDMQLDRVDGNKHYCKENCRYVDVVTQARNRSNSRVHTFLGEKLTVTEAIEKCKVLGYSTADSRVVYKRLAKGWNSDDALFTPKKKYAPRKREIQKKLRLKY